MTPSHSACNPSFMVCADDKGNAYWAGSVVKSERLSVFNINSSKIYTKNSGNMNVAEDKIKQCLPEEYHAIMKKIVKVESGGNMLAINVNGIGNKLQWQPSSLNEAIVTTRHLVNLGYSVDVGYAQINSQHFINNGFLAKSGIGIEDIFDPCINLNAGAKIFGDAYLSHGKDTVKALSVYNTGSPTKGVQNGYVAKVASK